MISICQSTIRYHKNDYKTSPAKSNSHFVGFVVVPVIELYTVAEMEEREKRGKRKEKRGKEGKRDAQQFT